MAKPKKKTAIVEEAIAAPKSDRHNERYPSWEAFVIKCVPADKYPTMNREYLK